MELQPIRTDNGEKHGGGFAAGERSQQDAAHEDHDEPSPAVLSTDDVIVTVVGTGSDGQASDDAKMSDAYTGCHATDRAQVTSGLQGNGAGVSAGELVRAFNRDSQSRRVLKNTNFVPWPDPPVVRDDECESGGDDDGEEDLRDGAVETGPFIQPSDADKELVQGATALCSFGFFFNHFCLVRFLDMYLFSYLWFFFIVFRAILTDGPSFSAPHYYGCCFCFCIFVVVSLSCSPETGNCLSFSSHSFFVPVETSTSCLMHNARDTIVYCKVESRMTAQGGRFILSFLPSHLSQSVGPFNPHILYILLYSKCAKGTTTEVGTGRKREGRGWVFVFCFKSFMWWNELGWNDGMTCYLVL